MSNCGDALRIKKGGMHMTSDGERVGCPPRYLAGIGDLIGRDKGGLSDV
jgi:hypothetical protein